MKITIALRLKFLLTGFDHVDQSSQESLSAEFEPPLFASYCFPYVSYHGGILIDAHKLAL
jgi:hypothetical protein